MIQLTDEQQQQLAKKIAAIFVVGMNDLEPYTELVRNKITEYLLLLDSDSQAVDSQINPQHNDDHERDSALYCLTCDQQGYCGMCLRPFESRGYRCGVHGEPDPCSQCHPSSNCSRLNASDAATRIRDKCVVHLQTTADALDVRQETECPSGTAFNSEATLRRRIATELSSLTLDELEPEKR